MSGWMLIRGIRYMKEDTADRICSLFGYSSGLSYGLHRAQVTESLGVVSDCHFWLVAKPCKVQC